MSLSGPGIYCSGLVTFPWDSEHINVANQQIWSNNKGIYSNRVLVLILWLWFQKWIKQDKQSNSKYNSRILATLTTTTQKQSRWNLTALLPKLQISDDHSFSSVMHENREWKPQRAIWCTLRSDFAFIITSCHLSCRGGGVTSSSWCIH